MHAAAITVIVAGVPGMLGWWILPHAHRFADVRPFLILVILAWAACWLAPLTRGRTIFVAAALHLPLALDARRGRRHRRLLGRAGAVASRAHDVQPERAHR